MESTTRNKKMWKMISFIVMVIAISILGAGTLYVQDYYHTSKEVMTTIKSSEAVEVIMEEDQLIFSPKHEKAKDGFIFYPGGKVEYTAYAPLMNQLAEKGYYCVLVKMPFNLAVLDSNRAEKVINAHHEISNWYMGGHSLGGAMAASFAGKYPDEVKGIILLGAYSADDLTKTSLKVLSIYGSEDKIMNEAKFEAAREKMPQVYEEFCIEGGNHSGYGNYGMQKGDGVAKMTNEDQQEIAANEIDRFIMAN